jgi:hypothetical protein
MAVSLDERWGSCQGRILAALLLLLTGYGEQQVFVAGA